MTMPLILLIEDNPAFRSVASDFFKGKTDLAMATEYSEALEQIVCRDDESRNLKQYDGVIIDCFFPYETGSSDISFGKQAIEKMLETDETGKYIERFAHEMGKYVDLNYPGLLKAVRSYACHDRYSGIENLNPRGEIFNAIEYVNTVLGKDEATRRLNQLLTVTFPWYSENDLRIKDYFGDLRESMLIDPSNQPLGILVAEECERRGVPFILATSTYHHDELTQPIASYCSGKGWTLVDCTQNNPDEKAQASFWQRAYDALARRCAEK